MEFFERFGILVRHSSAYHPQSNPVERYHQTLKRLLRVLCLDAGSEWDKHLPSILLALRTVSHENVFSNNPGLTDLVEHEIQLVSDQPVRTKPYRMSHRQNEILKTEINRMLKLGIIEVGESDYMSPMILVEVAGKTSSMY
ncbi:retrovirus-related Pol polyprotein from transposon 297 [Trichonephila clavipes]|nr:retrovirus-related Pol polyprotein from transposon 297 [Trichonephila clavipes]